MTREETAIVCATLSAAFPNWVVTSETIEMWQAMLQDLDGSVVFQAAQEWVLTDERYPSIAGIRKKCAEITGSLAPSASEAWAEVIEMVERYGSSRGHRPDWTHPLVSKTVKAIGYRHICMSDNIIAVRAHFTKMFNEFAVSYNNDIITSKRFELGGEMVALPYSTMVGLPSQKNLPASDQGVLDYEPRHTTR